MSAWPMTPDWQVSQWFNSRTPLSLAQLCGQVAACFTHPVGVDVARKRYDNAPIKTSEMRIVMNRAA